MSLLHATTIVIDGQGVLLRGPSGAGKSDLALRLIDDGASLVADDQTVITQSGGRLQASAPDRLSGLLEVRGLGIMPMPYEKTADIALLVDLVAPEEVVRLPDAAQDTVDGVALPRLRMTPFQASAAAKLRLALKALVPEQSLERMP